ncbi:hypothetical protein [Pyrobaculum sp.]|uniref:hypothetical protein n=1 Tax=Pyrobaculum sp. TaxID=2004705 RepID=UPI003D0E4BAF
MKSWAPLLVLLAALSASAGPTVVVTYIVKPDGTVESSAKLQEVMINNSPVAVNKSGVLLPPYSAVVREVGVRNVFPPFLRLETELEYVNGSLSSGVLYAKGGVAVKLTLRMWQILPISTPVVVSVAVDDKVAVLYEEPPSTISQVSGATVYYWTLLVKNYTEFTLTFKVREFGSFGAVRMPTVLATAALDINRTVNALEGQVRGYRLAAAQLSNLSNAVSTFTDVVYQGVQNLTQLVQILNATGIAMDEGATALNASTYAIEALRRQLLALGDAARGVALTINQSLLLVDYQYTALITAANLLETQSAALTSYSRAAGDAARSLGDIRRQLAVARDSLYKARYSVDNALRSVEEARGKVAGINATATLAREAIDGAVSLLDAAASQLRSLRDTIDSLISAVEAAISAVDSAAQTLETTSKSLGELAPLLNSTAASTRGNATVLRRDMPRVLLNASRNLYQISANLNKTGDEVTRLANPLYNASKTLRAVGRRLREAATSLEKVRADQVRALPRLGGVKSIVDNYTQTIEAQIRQLEMQKRALEIYYAAVNSSRIELHYFVELPIAVKNVSIVLSPRSKSLSARGVGLEGAFTPYAMALITVVSVIMFRKFRRKNGGGP